MFSLKSELFKKQQQAAGKSGEVAEVIRKQHKIKVAGEQAEKTPTYLKNPGVEERNARDIVATSEEVDKEKRVRPVLEAKAKLYEKMTSGDVLPDEESASMFLVDFEQKSLEARMTRNKEELKKKPQIGVHVASELKKASETTDNEWVEYVDSLGRTRMCLRKDLPSLQRMDEKLNVDRRAKQQDGDTQKTLLSDDMRREIEREEWEAQAMEEVNGPLHYENLRGGEIRELGVGYYAFSTDQETRDAQMKMLIKMREDTKKEKDNLRETQKKKRTALQARLEKVRERKIKKLKAQGKEVPSELLKPIILPEIEPETEDNKNDMQQEGVEVEVAEIKYAKQTTEREWDKGKDWLPAAPPKPPKSWKDPREERPEEFAPPSFYYSGPRNRGKPNTNASNTTTNSVPTTQEHIDPNTSSQYPTAAGLGAQSATTSTGTRVTPSDIISQIRQGVGNATKPSNTGKAGVSSVIPDLAKNMQNIIDKNGDKTVPEDSKTQSDVEARMNRVLNHVQQSMTAKTPSHVKNDDSANLYVPGDKPITMKIKPKVKKNLVLTSKTGLKDS